MATDPSGCCRKFFMALTCWKWQDMSVASTISTTKARSSLDEKRRENVSHVQHKKWSNLRLIKADLFWSLRN